MRDFKPIHSKQISHAPLRQNSRPNKPRRKGILLDLKFWVALMVLFSCGYITFSGVYREHALHTVSHIDQSKSIYGLIEIQIQNKNYQPISGIEVVLNKELAGVTNAYGEWYQFVRVPKNQGVNITFKRGKIFKTLKVKSDSFIKNGEEYVYKKRIVLNETKINSKNNQRLLSKNNSIQNKNIDKLKKAMPDIVTLLTGDVANTFESISIRSSGKSKSIKNLEKFVKKEAERLGLEVKKHSNWSINLTEMKYKSSLFIKVDVKTTFVGETTKSSFLREFNRKDKKLAEKLLATVKYHSFRPFPAIKILGQSYLVSSDSHSEYWQNQLAHKIEGISGDVYRLGKKFRLQDDISLTPILSHQTMNTRLNCNNGGTSQCFVFNMVYPNVGPNSKWQEKTIKLGGLKAGPSIQVYLQGLKAVSTKGNLWKVWVKPRSTPELLVIKNNRIVYSKSLLSGKQAGLPKIDLSKVLYAQKRVSKRKI